jgi:type II secretory pathway pseudopilin PulG
MLIAVVIVIVVLGIGGAFFAETVFRSKSQHQAMQLDEAQVIADAALERTRRAMWRYRNEGTWSWDEILAYCQNISTDTEVVKQDYLAKIGQSSKGGPSNAGSTDSAYFQAYPQMANSTGIHTKNDSPLPADAKVPTDGDMSERGVFIGWNAPFGEGAHHVVIRDNIDNGDGIDEDGDGDIYDIDGDDVASDLPTIDSDRLVYAIITVTLPDGTQRQTETLIEYVEAIYSPEGALITEGTMRMEGNFAVGGTLGNVQANEDVLLGPPPYTTPQPGTVSVSVNAGANLQGSLTTTPPGGLNPGAPAVDIPDINVKDYYNTATVVLTNTGQVIDRVTGTNLTGQPGYTGFTYQAASGTWKLDGNKTVASNVYYVEGNFSAEGQGKQFARYMTILAEGSVTMTGNYKIEAYRTDPNNPSTSNNTLAVAMGDLEVGGTANSGAYRQGIMYAREQWKIHGTPDINGSVIGKNIADSFTKVSNQSGVEPDASFSGNPKVSFNGMKTIIKNSKDTVFIKSVRRLK